MSGHSKWSTIKRKKGKTDAARGKVFTKIIREVTAAARTGGGDPDGNPRLRLAIDKAKQSNMPNDNIKRAIEKGTGGGEGSNIEELALEGYGASGVAVMLEVMTDNRNRTIPEIRRLFERNGGNLGSNGCVAYVFSKKGIIIFEKAGVDADALGLEAIEAGAEDLEMSDETIEIFTTPENMEQVRDALKAKGYNPVSSDITLTPQNMVAVDSEGARKIINLVEALEDHDDVQNVHTNADLPDELVK